MGYTTLRYDESTVFSILGFVSILLTGGIGILPLPKEWIAVKEAAFPGIIGIVTLLSIKTRKPLAKFFLLNEEIFDVPKIHSHLQATQQSGAFNRLLVRCTWWISVSFFLSALLNFILAKLIIKSPTGTEAFNAELGCLTLWSWPVILIPFMIITIMVLRTLVAGIHRYTGLTFQEIVISSSSELSETPEQKGPSPHA